MLRNRITASFNCPVYDPANGQALFIETMSEAPAVEVSPALAMKRSRDIELAAMEATKVTQLEAAERLKLLVESAKVQGRPQSMAWDGYLYWAGDVSQPPRLLTAAEFVACSAYSGPRLEQLCEMKMSAIRLISKNKLKKITHEKDQDLYKLILQVIHLHLIE